MSGSSDSDFVPTEDCVSVRQQTTLLDKRKRRRRSVKKIDYTKESEDDFFTGVTGYTHFNRTRKGGDVRPNAKVVIHVVHCRRCCTYFFVTCLHHTFATV